MKDTIIRNYVNSDKTNLNYVRLVLVARRSPEFPLHPLTIKDARKKEQILNKAILELGSIHLTSYGVALTEEKHLHNYLQILVLFILLLLKISEDLDMKRCLGKYGLEK